MILRRGTVLLFSFFYDYFSFYMYLKMNCTISGSSTQYETGNYLPSDFPDFTFIVSNPFPNTPITFVTERNASGSMDFT